MDIEIKSNSYSIPLLDALVRVLREIDLAFGNDNSNRADIAKSCIKAERAIRDENKTTIDLEELQFLLKRHAILFFEMTIASAIGTSLTECFLPPMNATCRTINDILQENFSTSSSFVSEESVQFKSIPESEYIKVAYIFNYIAKFGDRPRHWVYSRIVQILIPFLLSDDNAELIIQLKQGLPNAISALKNSYENEFEELFPWEAIAQGAITTFIGCKRDEDFYHFDTNQELLAAAEERLDHLYLIASNRYRVNANYILIPKSSDADQM